MTSSASPASGPNSAFDDGDSAPLPTLMTPSTAPGPTPAAAAAAAASLPPSVPSRSGDAG
eukprot:366571-Chlamydomonas_euryale.AAC.21